MIRCTQKNLEDRKSKDKMVNGNYTVYGDRPSSESEIVDDHVHPRTANKKTKRKFNRSASDLQLTLHPAQLDNETDSVKYEKKIKEPKLLRYVPTSEVEEHVVHDKFVTADRYDLKPPPADEPSRRHAHAFIKKPRNPTDGSAHYAYSRSSSSCSSPGGNLPTIAEHAEQYDTYRVRGPPSPALGLGEYISYESKLDKYFAKPHESKKFASKLSYNGSHPDSLYRVTAGPGDGRSRVVRAVRLLRWPAALLTVCIALAVFVYFLMPDSFDSDSDALNATYWEANIAGAHSYNPNHQVTTTTAVPAKQNSTEKNKNPETSNTPAQGTRTTEIDFYDISHVKNVPSIVDVLKEPKLNRKLPIEPVFPEIITPEVQYGNEKADNDKLRANLSENNSVPDDSTLKPHITQKPERPLAIYFKEGEVISATTDNVVKTGNANNHYGNTKTTRNSLSTYPRSKTYFSTQAEPRRPITEEYFNLQPVNVNFTSGHSKLFGISIEDADKYKPTTQSAFYNTKVSPTLPVWRDLADSTTKKYPVLSVAEGQQCRSTRLDICRGVLPYDLAMTNPVLPVNLNPETLLTQLEYLIAGNCSDRVRHFTCSLLEPECSPQPNSQKMPCQNLCRAVLDSCEGMVPQELMPLFKCKHYPQTGCYAAREPCFTRELQCSDGTCIPRDWICDGKPNCPKGEDESKCILCNKNEFRCRAGGCIQKRWLCDGYADCADGEDEAPVSCETVRLPPKTSELAEEAAEEAAGSAPAPSVRKPNKPHRDQQQPSAKAYNSHGAVESDSKELLMTSDSGNALKRNYTRRPSPSRLLPYTRPSLKDTQPTPEAKPVEDAPQNKAVQTAPQNKSVQTAPQNKAVQTGPQNKAVQTAPQNKAVQTGPQNKAVQTAPQNLPVIRHNEDANKENNADKETNKDDSSEKVYGDADFFEAFERDMKALDEKREREMRKEHNIPKRKPGAKVQDKEPDAPRDSVENIPPEVAATKLDDNNNLDRELNGAEMLRRAQQAIEEQTTGPEEEEELIPERPRMLKSSRHVGFVATTESAHASPCAPGELRCVDGFCITLHQLCDGTIDCFDHADEDNCYT